MGNGPSQEGTPKTVPEASKEEIKKPTTLQVPEVSKAREENKKPLELVKEQGQVRKDPHKLEAIIKEADNLSSGSLNGQIQTGIYLNNRKKKYWIEKNTGHNCFVIFARGLLITWSENQSFWQWASLKETSGVEIEIASLLNVCWLEIHGRFETSYLTPEVTYEVVFLIMMELGYGWTSPVNLRLKLPDGSVQHHNELLLEKPKGKWFELKAGEFMTKKDQAGEMEFSLFEYEGGQWKKGLIIKGAIIRPKAVTESNSPRIISCD